VLPAQAAAAAVKTTSALLALAALVVVVLVRSPARELAAQPIPAAVAAVRV
jgi:hypothetical protein